jgi:mycothiol synthase
MSASLVSIHPAPVECDQRERIETRRILNQRMQQIFSQQCYWRNEMNITPHPYRGLKDFIAMTSILAIGRKTDTTAYYVHTGDLSWWMFYTDYDDAHWQEHVFIWEQDGQTIGWTLLDPVWRSFDVYMLPGLRGTAQENYILDWSIARLSEIVRQHGKNEIQTMWVAAHDRGRTRQLEQRGFERGEYAMSYLERSLKEHLPAPKLPDGFNVQHRAVGSGQSLDKYRPRYQRFVDSPVYLSSLDLVTVAPEGEFASFCIVWPDPVNRVGLFEPVGTHPDFQAQGLRRAVVTEGLRQLQECGMRRAAVCVEAADPSTQGLFEAVGFEQQYQLYTYIKNIK